MISLFLLAFPLTGLLMVIFLPYFNFYLLRSFSLFISLIVLVYSLFYCCFFIVSDLGVYIIRFNSFFPTDVFPYMFGISLNVNVFSLFLIILTNILIVFCILITWNWLPFFFSLRSYIVTIFSIQISCISFFLSSNLILFYIFFESVLIPMYILIGIWGLRDRKIHASYQFFLYTFFGSLFMIFAIILATTVTNSFDFSYLEFYSWFFENKTSLYFPGGLLSSIFQIKLIYLIWFLFFISFAIKIPMVPFHIWLPEAHVEAPTSGSIILAGVLLKFGTYGFYKILVLMLPVGLNFFARLIICMSLIAIFFASLITYVQIDLKKIIAYSSVSHMGFVTLGLVLHNVEGLVGSLMMMLSHGFISGALFYSVGILYERYGTRNIFAYGGLRAVMPIYTVFFFLLTLFNMNLPLTFGFVSEFLVLLGTYGLQSKIISLLATFGIFTNGVYCIWLYNRLCLGRKISNTMEYMDVDKREIFILSSFCCIIVLLGIFPNGLLLSLEHSVYYGLWVKNIYFI